VGDICCSSAVVSGTTAGSGWNNPSVESATELPDRQSNISSSFDFTRLVSLTVWILTGIDEGHLYYWDKYFPVGAFLFIMSDPHL
jgi:hypothetical protein